MVPSIARQSVIIKCNQQSSVLLGNYEFFYLAGLMKKLYNLDLNEEMQPMELLEGVQSKLDSLNANTPQEEHLIKMARNFKPDEKVDEEMKELFRWGATEENLWKVQI